MGRVDGFQLIKLVLRSIPTRVSDFFVVSLKKTLSPATVAARPTSELSPTARSRRGVDGYVQRLRTACPERPRSSP